MTQPLTWSHRTSEIAEAGLHVAKTASESERSALAVALDAVACEEVKAEYVIRSLGAGRYRMSGKVSARLTQRCIVTLEPVPARIEESFEIELLPPEAIPEASAAEIEVLAAPDIEPLERGTIEAGRIVFETLSASLDPYPRKQGALFEWQDGADASGQEPSGPFAGLKKLQKDG
jgi:Large ribosomal RNA subunit accumulation protein YceD